MSERIVSLGAAGRACATCARGVRSFGGRYREFLLTPGTLFTFASALLLLVAIIVAPHGAVSSHEGAGRPLYIASALVGSVFIWWSAMQGIRARDFTADIPVSVATIAAIAIGQFSAAAVVAVLLLVGGMLEEFVAARAGHALTSLEKLLPDEVTVRRDGRDVVVPLEQVRVGDTVLVRPGERVAVDGEVVFGQASLSEAAITGESLPVEKAVGDRVFAGTLASAGALEVRAKAPIERILDRYAKLYTPTALLLALILWLVYDDPLRAITMLIVFCPCVMVLATPTALVASIGNAALRGSLVKQGATVEALARVDTVVFDKTGTLTTGNPRLVEIISLNGLDEQALLRFAASAERLSEHPLGQALVRAAQERGLELVDPDEFEQLAGLGVRARTDGSELLLGRSSLLSERGVHVPAAVETRAATLAAPGRSVVPLALNRQVAGLFVLEDALRDEAAETVARLHRLGLRTLLVSGDRRETRRARCGERRYRGGARGDAATREGRDRAPPAGRGSPGRIRRRRCQRRPRARHGRGRRRHGPRRYRRRARDRRCRAPLRRPRKAPASCLPFAGRDHGDSPEPRLLAWSPRDRRRAHHPRHPAPRDRRAPTRALLDPRDHELRPADHTAQPRLSTRSCCQDRHEGLIPQTHRPRRIAGVMRSRGREGSIRRFTHRGIEIRL